jgi:SAM-dependent methyltransferase
VDGSASVDTLLLTDRFPRSNEYNPAWVIASCSSGANALWLTEWLTSAVELRAGMRVLDLGCGRAMSSIFLRREFGVQVWATDLWFSPSENLQRIRDAGVEDGVYPIHAEARSLPFADDFFDAIISIDSFNYYGTDDYYLNYLARFVKAGGPIGIAGAGLMREMEGPIPDSLAAWWEHGMCSLHSAAWWRRHWEKTGILDVELADSMPEGWQFWLQWLRVVAPENLAEIRAVESDSGGYLGYVRAVGRRQPDARLDDVIQSIPAQYNAQPLLRRS